MTARVTPLMTRKDPIHPRSLNARDPHDLLHDLLGYTLLLVFFYYALRQLPPVNVTIDKVTNVTPFVNETYLKLIQH